ncbi:hypothetical protein M433DRAFT_153860, partial [Acidomyces richmondensis BFW]
RENWARTASWIIHLAAAVRPLLDLARSFQFDVPASLKSLSLASCISGQKIRMCFTVCVLYPQVHSGLAPGTLLLVR